MNSAEPKEISLAQIDASCRVPLLALFVGAAVALVAGLALALVAAMTFHKPELFASCPILTYGHAVAAANDLILYGFGIPAGLGVILWIFARLSRAELALPMVPFVAAHLWHLGVLIGTIAILTGNSTGFTWLEYPRCSTVLLFVAFVLVAISAMATFGLRKQRELYPAHWFLLASLAWFPWLLSSTDLFLLAWRVRGGAQPVIDWWYGNNLVFVWLALVGVGAAFYLLPKLSGRPLHSYFFALFAFWTLMIFGTWCGIPAGAPVPAWVGTVSTLASALLVIPLIAIALITGRTTLGSTVTCKGGPLCYVKVGMISFIISGFLIVATACPHVNELTQFSWFDFGRVQLQLLGFFTMIMFGAIYELLPKIMGSALPFPGFVRGQIWLCWAGLALFIVPLLWAGIQQTKSGFDPAASLNMLRISSMGLALLLLASLLFLANILIMAVKWNLSLVKVVIAAVKAPLENAEVKP